MMPAVPALATYLDKLPVQPEGMYLAGSAALDDWQPGSSDLDLVVVTPGAVSETDLAALEALHGRLADRPYLDVIYLPASALGSRDGYGRWRSSKVTASFSGVSRTRAPA
jgi:predicted nucleotidyltransferase